MTLKSEKIRTEVKSLHEFYKIYGGPQHVTLFAEDFDYMRKYGVLQLPHSQERRERLHGSARWGWIDSMTVRRGECRGSYAKKV